MSTQMEINRGSVTLEQITNQILAHQNELLLFREEKAAMQQQLASLMLAPAPPPAPAPLLPARKALLFNHIFDGDKTMFKSHGTEDCALRDKTWGPKETKAAYTAPGQRDTDGDVQMTGVNATGFKKQSKKTENASAKASTAAKWVSQEVLAQRHFAADRSQRTLNRDIKTWHSEREFAKWGTRKPKFGALLSRPYRFCSMELARILPRWTDMPG
ncbi:hypothetical protein E4U32_001128 [Claviceps aff. humidiphila group G2b]|nr:hypothetical protein E4U32_001128 [Claviceps aff. humidiphila group G2b]